MSESSNSPRRKKRFGPPIDLDELYNAPNLRGMCSFLERNPEEGTRQDSTTQAPGDILILPGAGNKAVEAVHQQDEKVKEGISPGASDTPAQTIQQAAGDMGYVSIGGRVLKVRRCERAQEGHSRGEQRLYAALWKEAQPEQTDTRVITIGMGRLAQISRMDITNVRKNLRSLEQKCSLEVIAREISESQQGRSYRIFSPERILKERAKAGLVWMVRSKGVMFIDLKKAAGNLKGITPGDSDIPGSQITPGDGDMLRAVWQECRRRAPDCSMEEVEYFFRLKSGQLLGGGKAVRDPAALLLAAVPKCFEGAAPPYLAYRRSQKSGAGL